MILPILKYGDPLLTTPTQPVEEIDAEIKKLVKDMVETLYAAPGLGLAANQVGSHHRIAVIDTSGGENPEELLVLINPEIIESEGEETTEEGCLSFPEITVEIPRPKKVLVRALNLKGEEFELEAEGVLARAVCHETDHLDGVLFIDYITGMAKEMVHTQIKRLKRQGQWD